MLSCQFYNLLKGRGCSDLLFIIKSQKEDVSKAHLLKNLFLALVGTHKRFTLSQAIQVYFVVPPETAGISLNRLCR